MRLRVVAADDNSFVLDVLVSTLEGAFDVVGTARNGNEALEVVRACHRDVLVTDLEMPGLSGIELTKEVLKTCADLRVVICTVETDADILQAAERAGAFGFVAKTQIPRDLIVAVNAVALGRYFVSPSLRTDSFKK